MKLPTYWIGFISAILFAVASCSNVRSGDVGYFEKLVQAYRDSITTSDKCEKIVLWEWNTCLEKGVIQEEAVAATVASDSYLDGSVSEGIARTLFEIISRDSTQFDVLATILALNDSEKYKKTAEQLAELFLYEALWTEVEKDGGSRPAQNYINDIAKLYPSYNRFINQIGIGVEVINDIIYFNGRKMGSPTEIL